jgi:hypothetical protein
VGAIRVCSPGSWGRSGNAIGEFGVFTQPLAGADLAGVRKVGRLLPAELRENGWTVARAAGQLPIQIMGRVPYRTRDRCPQGCSPAPHLRCAAGARVAKLEAVRRQEQERI